MFLNAVQHQESERKPTTDYIIISQYYGIYSHLPLPLILPTNISKTIALPLSTSVLSTELDPISKTLIMSQI